MEGSRLVNERSACSTVHCTGMRKKETRCAAVQLGLERVFGLPHIEHVDDWITVTILSNGPGKYFIWGSCRGPDL